ncbi:MAG: MFS transporter [Promethearchaeota archaeon]
MVRYKWTVLIITTIGVFMSSLDASIVNIAIPSLSRDLKTSFEVVQWIPIIYLLVQAVTLISFGRLSDLKGRKLFFLFGIFLFTFASFFSTFVASGIILVIFRAIQGIGSSFISANAPSMITDIFPREETGKALGINVATIYLGLIIGPVLGGIIVQFSTWRLIFFINVPIGIILIIVGWFKLRKVNPGIKEERFDIWGTLLFMSFLVTLLLALTIANLVGWGSIQVILLLIISTSSIILFIYIESKAKYPLFKLSLFRRNKVFSFANFAALFNYTAISGVSFLLSIYLQSILGISPAITALFLLPTTITMASIAPLSGRFSDKWGTRILTTLGMVIMAIGYIILSIFIRFLPIIYILITQFVVGFGIGLFSSPNNSAIMNAVEPKDHGIAAGTLSTMRVVGQSISVALLSAILTLFIPLSILNPILSNSTLITDPTAKQEFVIGMQILLIVSSIICLAGAFLSFMRGKKTLNDKNDFKKSI